MPINYKINNLLSAVMPGVECRTKKLALESIFVGYNDKGGES
jgi:hypothetical protein